MLTLNFCRLLTRQANQAIRQCKEAMELHHLVIHHSLKEVVIHLPVDMVLHQR